MEEIDYARLSSVWENKHTSGLLSRQAATLRRVARLRAEGLPVCELPGVRALVEHALDAVEREQRSGGAEVDEQQQSAEEHLAGPLAALVRLHGMPLLQSESHQEVREARSLLASLRVLRRALCGRSAEVKAAAAEALASFALVTPGAAPGHAQPPAARARLDAVDESMAVSSLVRELERCAASLKSGGGGEPEREELVMSLVCALRDISSASETLALQARAAGLLGPGALPAILLAELGGADGGDCAGDGDEGAPPPATAGLGFEGVEVSVELLWSVIEPAARPGYGEEEAGAVLVVLHRLLGELVTWGYRAVEQELRNDVCVLLTLLARVPEHRKLFARTGCILTLLHHATPSSSTAAAAAAASAPAVGSPTSASSAAPAEASPPASPRQQHLHGSRYGQAGLEFRQLLWSLLATLAADDECRAVIVQGELVRTLAAQVDPDGGSASAAAAAAAATADAAAEWTPSQRRELTRAALLALQRLAPLLPHQCRYESLEERLLRFVGGKNAATEHEERNATLRNAATLGPAAAADTPLPHPRYAVTRARTATPPSGHGLSTAASGDRAASAETRRIMRAGSTPACEGDGRGDSGSRPAWAAASGEDQHAPQLQQPQLQVPRAGQPSTAEQRRPASAASSSAPSPPSPRIRTLRISAPGTPAVHTATAPARAIGCARTAGTAALSLTVPGRPALAANDPDGTPAERRELQCEALGALLSSLNARARAASSASGRVAAAEAGVQSAAGGAAALGVMGGVKCLVRCSVAEVAAVWSLAADEAAPTEARSRAAEVLALLCAGHTPEARANRAAARKAGAVEALPALLAGYVPPVLPTAGCSVAIEGEDGAGGVSTDEYARRVLSHLPTRLMLAAVSLAWQAVVPSAKNAAYFCLTGGVDALMDAASVAPLPARGPVLRCLADLCAPGRLAAVEQLTEWRGHYTNERDLAGGARRGPAVGGLGSSLMLTMSRTGRLGVSRSRGGEAVNLRAAPRARTSPVVGVLAAMWEEQEALASDAALAEARRGGAAADNESERGSSIAGGTRNDDAVSECSSERGAAPVSAGGYAAEGTRSGPLPDARGPSAVPVGRQHQHQPLHPQLDVRAPLALLLAVASSTEAGVEGATAEQRQAAARAAAFAAAAAKVAFAAAAGPEDNDGAGEDTKESAAVAEARAYLAARRAELDAEARDREEEASAADGQHRKEGAAREAEFVRTVAAMHEASVKSSMERGARGRPRPGQAAARLRQQFKDAKEGMLRNSLDIDATFRRTLGATYTEALDDGEREEQQQAEGETRRGSRVRLVG